MITILHLMHLDEQLPIKPFIEGNRFTNPKFSPDGQNLSYLRKTDQGTDLMVYNFERNFSQPLVFEHKISTGTAYGGETYCWTRQSDAIVFSSKGELFVVNIDGGEPTKLNSFGKSFHPQIDNNGLYFISEHEDHMSLAYSRQIEENKYDWPQKLPIQYHFIYDPIKHKNGHYFIHIWDFPYMSWDQSELIRLNPDGSKVTIAGGENSSISQPRLSPEHNYLAFISEDNGWLNLWLADGDGKNPKPLVEENREHSYTTWVSGERNHVWIHNDRIIFTRNENGFFTLNMTDLNGSVTELDLPPGYYEKLHTDNQGNLCYLFSNHKYKLRIEIVSIDKSGNITDKRIIAQSGVVLDKYVDQMIEPEHISFPTKDKSEAYGLLYRPKKTTEPTPLLILVHGGPTGMFYNKFRLDPQYFVHQGWTVLGINHRGSIGFGRDYRQKLMKHWGEYDVDDCVDAVNYLSSQNIIDDNKIAIMGGSAGGYTTLMALIRYPEVFAAGVNLYGVSDLFLLAEETHYLEAHYSDQLIGSLPEEAEKYSKKSPINHAENITAPLLILQGEEDPVVPKNQSEMIYDKVKGKKEIKIYDGEGHGFKKTSTYQDMYPRIDSFLRKNVIYKS